MITYNSLEEKLNTEHENLELESLRKQEEILYRLQTQKYKEGLANRKKMKYKKHYIIRESDFNKLPAAVKKSYNVSFKPLTRDYFKKRSTWFYIKGKKYLGDQYAMHEYPREMIRRITNIPLYTQDYNNWLLKYNDENELVIRAGLRMPESRLGLGIFREKS